MKLQARPHYLTMPVVFSSLLATLVAKCFSCYKIVQALVHFFPVLTYLTSLGPPSGLVQITMQDNVTVEETSVLLICSLKSGIF